MAQESDSKWLEVIGKALSYLCVQEFTHSEEDEKPDLIAKVQFLERLGFSTDEAAVMMGSTGNSVKTNIRQRENKKGAKGGTAKKKRQ